MRIQMRIIPCYDWTGNKPDSDRKWTPINRIDTCINRTLRFYKNNYKIYPNVLLNYLRKFTHPKYHKCWKLNETKSDNFENTSSMFWKNMLNIILLMFPIQEWQHIATNYCFLGWLSRLYSLKSNYFVVKSDYPD
jgi:hypothetical protein